jgi:hypothetical protein
MTRPYDRTPLGEKLRALAMFMGAWALAWVRLLVGLPGDLRAWWRGR